MHKVSSQIFFFSSFCMHAYVGGWLYVVMVGGGGNGRGAEQAEGAADEDGAEAG